MPIRGKCVHHDRVIAAALPVCQRRSPPATCVGAAPIRATDHHEPLTTPGAAAECLALAHCPSSPGSRSAAAIRRFHPDLRRQPRRPQRAQRAARSEESIAPDRRRPLSAPTAGIGAMPTSCDCGGRWRRSLTACQPERFSQADWHGLLNGLLAAGPPREPRRLTTESPCACFTSRRYTLRLPSSRGCRRPRAARPQLLAQRPASHLAHRSGLPHSPIWAPRVSVGEVQAAAAPAAALAAAVSGGAGAGDHLRLPPVRRAPGRALQQRRGGRAFAIRPAGIGTPLSRSRPSAASRSIMETELRPNLHRQCRRRRIPGRSSPARACSRRSTSSLSASGCVVQGNRVERRRRRRAGR